MLCCVCGCKYLCMYLLVCLLTRLLILCCPNIFPYHCFQHVPLYSAPCSSMRWKRAKRWAQGPKAFFILRNKFVLSLSGSTAQLFPAVLRGWSEWRIACCQMAAAQSCLVKLNDSAPEMKLSCCTWGSGFILHWQSCRSRELLFFICAHVTVRNEIAGEAAHVFVLFVF